jgi:hypothetical protein
VLLCGLVAPHFFRRYGEPTPYAWVQIMRRPKTAFRWGVGGLKSTSSNTTCQITGSKKLGFISLSSTSISFLFSSLSLRFGSSLYYPGYSSSASTFSLLVSTTISELTILEFMF